MARPLPFKTQVSPVNSHMPPHTHGSYTADGERTGSVGKHDGCDMTGNQTEPDFEVRFHPTLPPLTQICTAPNLGHTALLSSHKYTTKLCLELKFNPKRIIEQVRVIFAKNTKNNAVQDYFLLIKIQIPTSTNLPELCLKVAKQIQYKGI